MNRHAPALVGAFGVLVPAALVVEDIAAVVDIARRAGGAGRQGRCGQQGGEQNKVAMSAAAFSHAGETITELRETAHFFPCPAQVQTIDIEVV